MAELKQCLTHSCLSNKEDKCTEKIIVIGSQGNCMMDTTQRGQE